MYQGVNLSDNEDTREIDDPHRLLDIDLDGPLSTEYSLPAKAHKRETPISTDATSPLPEALNSETKSNHKKHKNVGTLIQFIHFIVYIE